MGRGRCRVGRVLLGAALGLTGCSPSTELEGLTLRLTDWSARRSVGESGLGTVDLEVVGTLDAAPWCCWFSGTDPGGDTEDWVVVPGQRVVRSDDPALVGWSGAECGGLATWRLTDGVVALVKDHLELVVEVRDPRTDELVGVIDDTVPKFEP